jgi:hypothetical protein
VLVSALWGIERRLRNEQVVGSSPTSGSTEAQVNDMIWGFFAVLGLRHGVNAADNIRSRPAARIVAVSKDPPACDTTPFPAPSTRTRG